MGGRLDGQKAAAWRRMGHWEGSGLSVSGFCRREGVSVRSIYYWRQRLADDAAVDLAELFVQRSPCLLLAVGCNQFSSGTALSNPPALPPQPQMKRWAAKRSRPKQEPKS